MHELCIKSIIDKDQQTLQEILFKFSYIRQLYSHLDEQYFQPILNAITYQQLPPQSSLLIQSHKIYFFFEKGHIINRQKQGKLDGVTKKSMVRSMRKKMVMNDRQLYRKSKNKQSNRYYIAQYESYFVFNGNNLRYEQMNYIPRENKTSLILIIHPNKLTDTIRQKIEEINYDKLKCLYNFPIFEQIDREVIKQEINHFHFTTFKFHQYLYHQHHVQPMIYFVKGGMIQMSSKGIQKTYVLDGKFMIGYRKQEKQRARSISETVICYSICHHLLSSLLKKITINNSQEIHQKHAPSCHHLTNHNTPLSNNGDQSSLLRQNAHIFKGKQEQPSFKQNISMLNRVHSQLFKKKTNQYKTQTTQQISIKLQKRMVLRRHFSNFYNEIFDAYSQKKIKQIGLNINDQQNLRLYEIKLLKKTMPDMDGIKEKLKKTRQFKMRMCKKRLKEMQSRRIFSGSVQFQNGLRITQL